MTTKAPKIPEDFGKTSACKNSHHGKCAFRADGDFAEGVGTADGTFYMCPCKCHNEQVVDIGYGPVKIETISADDPAVEDLGVSDDEVVATEDAMQAHLANLTPGDEGFVPVVEVVVPDAPKNLRETKREAKKAPKAAKAPKAEKAPKAPKVEKADGPVTKLTTEMKQALRSVMATTLESMLADWNTTTKPAALDDVPMPLIEAELEGRWLKYIDPVKDAARLAEWRAQRTA